MRDAVAAAAAALLIALLNEWRAQLRARAAAREREEHQEELRQVVLRPDRRQTPDARRAPADHPPEEQRP